MPSMQLSGPRIPQSLPIHMEPCGSSMPRSMPSEDDHGNISAPGDISAQEDTSASEEQTRRDRILRRNEPQKVRYYHGRLVIWPNYRS
ncbi:hypothetical protein RYX36_020806 [Vicia faba]